MPETIDAALRDATRMLASAGVDDSRTDAGVLLAHVLGRGRSWLLAHGDDGLAAPDGEVFRTLTRRRAAGEPVAYLTGVQEFWSLPFRVDPRVLVPRPESEHLVEEVLARCLSPSPLVVDVGAGSGCVGLALAHERPGARVLAVDISPGALEVVELNARALGLDDRLVRLRADGLSAVAAGVDAVVANPPYVSLADWADLPPHIREHEPEQAFTCGADDLSVTRRIIGEAPRVLRPGAVLAVEVDPRRAAEVVDMVSGSLWRARGTRRDLSGRIRVVWAETSDRR